MSGDSLKNKDVTPEEKIKKGLIRKVALMAITLILVVAVIFAMTAAWYTNTVQTTGLIFEVSGWGLDGNVDIGNEFNNAAPGDSGTIPVQVYNSSEGIIDVNFKISKAGLYNDVADMRKRLYFYIDDTATINDEVTERVYVNSIENYSYTVLPKHNLSLDVQGNGAKLTWEWVYDVLGYYFYGTVTTSTSAEISEYLRPIIYDFDKATFNNNKLQTVDGSTTAMSFITSLSQKDGFDGVVTSSLVSADGKIYYPVSVDGNGTGVWIYCCDYSEIEYENVIDTALGNTSDSKLRRFQTTLNVLAEQKTLTVATVDNKDDLVAALADDVHNMIVLSEDITLTENITLAKNSEKIIDLADKTLTGDSTGNAITAQQGSSVTIMNGTLKGNNSSSEVLITAIGSDVALSSVTVSDVANAIIIADEQANGQDSRVNLVDCKITTNNLGIRIKGNGPLTKTDTYLNIENSEIVSGGLYALFGNGNSGAKGNYGTNITIKNSLLEGTYAGIYHPQKESYLKIEKSTIKGITPLAIKGGTVDIIETKILASNAEGVAELIQEPVLGKSGFSDTGAGIYVETGYNYGCSLNISGKTEITSYYSEAILLFETTNDNYKISVSGGSYSQDVSNFVANGYVCTKDGDRYVVKAK